MLEGQCISCEETDADSPNAPSSGTVYCGTLSIKSEVSIYMPQTFSDLTLKKICDHILIEKDIFPSNCNCPIGGPDMYDMQL